MSDLQFTVEAVKSAALAESQNSDFGVGEIDAGLAALLQTYDQHIVDPDGRKKVFQRVVNLLQTRLGIAAAQSRYPEIANEKIVRPVVLTGLPRSGTSALFNLLAADPASRALLQWETHHPDPVDGKLNGRIDPRKQAIIDRIEAQRQRNPEFDAIHYASADTPEECVLVHALALNGVHIGYECLLEPYRSWFQSCDLGDMYAYYLDVLRMLQWRDPGERWLLKAPAHMWAVPALIKTMPDVCIVWGHRDPLEVVPSIASLTSLAAKMYGGDIPSLEKQLLGPLVLDFYATSLERGLADRDTFPERYFIDYSFKQFVDQPSDTVDAIYAHFDIDMTAEARMSIDAHIADNPKGKHGKHRYDYESFGLTEAMITSRFDFYLSDERYNKYL